MFKNVRLKKQKYLGILDLNIKNSCHSMADMLSFMRLYSQQYGQNMSIYI
jgi:hypothetical protein